MSHVRDGVEIFLSKCYVPKVKGDRNILEKVQTAISALHETLPDQEMNGKVIFFQIVSENIKFYGYRFFFRKVGENIGWKVGENTRLEFFIIYVLKFIILLIYYIIL